MTIKETTQVTFSIPSETEKMMEFEKQIDESWHKTEYSSFVVFEKTDMHVF